MSHHNLATFGLVENSYNVVLIVTLIFYLTSIRIFINFYTLSEYMCQLLSNLDVNNLQPKIYFGSL